MKPLRVVLLMGLVTTFAINATAGDGQIHRAAEPVANLYLVTLNIPELATSKSPTDVVRKISANLATVYGGKLRLVMAHAATGFSVQMTEVQASSLARHPSVASVEEVSYFHESSSPQTSAPWQLDRIDQSNLPLDGIYRYNEDGGGAFIYVIGHGVYRDHVEFLQTGGASRVVKGAKFDTFDNIAPGDSTDYGYWPCGTLWPDGLSHGTGAGAIYSGHETAVASIAAGNNYGAAKNAWIVPIRVWSCDATPVGTTENLARAFDWIMTPYDGSNPYSGNPYLPQHQPYSPSNPTGRNAPAVVNLSGGVGICDAGATFLENEINAVVGHPWDATNHVCTSPSSLWPGAPVVVSANNYNTDTINTTPARMSFTNRAFQTCGHVISVGATNSLDARWQSSVDEGRCNTTLVPCGGQTCVGSNFGPNADIYAPGANITAAWNRLYPGGVPGGWSNSAVTPEDPSFPGFYRSGTSWAAPVAAGVLARIMSVEGRMNCDAAWVRLRDTGSPVIAWDTAPVCPPNDPDPAHCTAPQNKRLVNRVQ